MKQKIYDLFHRFKNFLQSDKVKIVAFIVLLWIFLVFAFLSGSLIETNT